MGRELKPCGTRAAYVRHLRKGETPCEPCRAASRKQKMDRVDGDRGVRAVAKLEAVPDPEPESFDPLEDAKDNLRIVKLALRDAVPREVSALSKRRQELVALIAELGGKKEVSLADELEEFRRRRSGA